jgi:hypothetical protein
MLLTVKKKKRKSFLGNTRRDLHSNFQERKMVSLAKMTIMRITKRRIMISTAVRC